MLAVVSGFRIPYPIQSSDHLNTNVTARDPTAESLLADKLGSIALNGIIANIGPPAGADEGIVIASPSTGNKPGEPDYYVSPPHDEQAGYS